MRFRFALLISLAFLMVSCSPDDAADTSTTSSVPLDTTTTIVATTSTTVPTTSTTMPTTTTSDATTTTLAPTTTLVEGDVELSDEGIEAGSAWLPFGHDDDEVVSSLTALLGPPSADSGWLDSLTDGWEQFGVCPSPNVRGVSWGEGGGVSLQVLFTDADTDFWSGGVQHFFAFFYSGSSAPTDLATTEGIEVGSSLGDLKAAYDPTKIVIDEAFFDPAQGFWSYDLQSWTGLWGFATGQSDAHVISSINGGRGCGE